MSRYEFVKHAGTTHLRRVGIGLVAILVLLLPPTAGLRSLVDNTASADENPVAGVTFPTGSAAKTFSYNPESKLWENAYYTFNPITQETLPKQPLEYTYNASTGHWDTTIWEFHPNVDAYEPVALSVTQPPSGAITHGGPAPVPAAVVAPPPQSPVQATASQDDAVRTVGNTPPPNLSALQQTGDGALTVQNNIGVTLEQNLTSQALSGNALGQNNYLVGDATSGNAAAIANIINLLQSSAGLGGPGLATFVRDIQGDVNGDLLIDPAAFMQPAATPQGIGDIAINTAIDSTITNNINLTATSGSAILDNNYQAGNATSGSADAVANVVNMINSVIAANQSFLGVVNIYGNYTGNILVPTDTLNSLLASNGPASAQSVEQAAQAAVNASNTSTQTINNNVDLAATSGSATQYNNYATGSATTGDALTNLTILNLTGHEVSAANSLLVFVNVLGKWVGVIMDAPAGATSAAFTGGNASSAGGAGAGQSDYHASGDVNVDNVSNQTINNNITAHATTGDATVSNNYLSGNATSGKATASANIVNILNSAFNLSKWFGVLFINVFGSWFGNFGAAAPEPTVASETETPTGTPTAVFSFSPGGGQAGVAGALSRIDRSAFPSDEAFDQFTEQVSEVLAAHDVTPQNPTNTGTTNNSTGGTLDAGLALLPLALGITGFAALATERIRSFRRRAITV